MVVDKGDVDAFVALAAEENLAATPVAVVTDTGRMRMYFRDRAIVDISREFLNTNGVKQQANARVSDKITHWFDEKSGTNFAEETKKVLSDLNVCAKKGLSETFDSTIGARSGVYALGWQEAAHARDRDGGEDLRRGDGRLHGVRLRLFPLSHGEQPLCGAIYSVVGSVSKVAATGADYRDVRLTLQEFFERMTPDENVWGVPTSALLGAVYAQMGLELGAIGGKDSMSGTFEHIHVPPTLISFALAPAKASGLISNVLKGGEKLWRLPVPKDAAFVPDFGKLKGMYAEVYKISEAGYYFCDRRRKRRRGRGGRQERSGQRRRRALCAFFRRIVHRKLRRSRRVDQRRKAPFPRRWKRCMSAKRRAKHSSAKGRKSRCKTRKTHTWVPCPGCSPCARRRAAKRRTAIFPPPSGKRIPCPKSPGPACLFPSSRAPTASWTRRANSVCGRGDGDGGREKPHGGGHRRDGAGDRGGDRQGEHHRLPGRIFGRRRAGRKRQIHRHHLPQSVYRGKIAELLEKRGGLILGICNGFQALVKLGLVPYGKVVPLTADSPTLTFNNTPATSPRWWRSGWRPISLPGCPPARRASAISCPCPTAKGNSWRPRRRSKRCGRGGRSRRSIPPGRTFHAIAV